MIAKGHAPKQAIAFVNDRVDCPPFNDLCIVCMAYTIYGGDLSESMKVLRNRLAHQNEVKRILKEGTQGSIMTSIMMLGALIMMAFWMHHILNEEWVMFLNDASGIHSLKVASGLVLAYFIAMYGMIKYIRCQ